MTHDTKFNKAVWDNGSVIPAFEHKVTREDYCGTRIRYADLDNLKSEYGWVIEKIALATGNDLSNLRPVHWKNAKLKRKTT